MCPAAGGAQPLRVEGSAALYPCSSQPLTGGHVQLGGLGRVSPPPTGGPTGAATTTSSYFVSDLLAPDVVLRASTASSRHPQDPELADASVTSGAETRWISSLQSSGQLRAEPPGPRCGHSVLHPVSSALSPYNRPSSLKRKDPDHPWPGSVQQTLRSSCCVPDALLGIGDPLQNGWTCSRADRCSPTGQVPGGCAWRRD